MTTQTTVHRPAAPILVAALTALSLTLLGTAAGCVSYVNIPAEPGDTAFNSVNGPPVPRLMGTALAFAASIFPPADTQQYTVTLPHGASDSVKRNIASRLPGQGALRVNDSLDAATPNYSVTAIRVRGSYADVEILLPDAADGKRFLELRLHSSLTGWSVTGSKRSFAPDLAEVEVITSIPAPPPTTTSPPSLSGRGQGEGSAHNARQPHTPSTPAQNDRPLMPVRPADPPLDKPHNV